MIDLLRLWKIRRHTFWNRLLWVKHWLRRVSRDEAERQVQRSGAKLDKAKRSKAKLDKAKQGKAKRSEATYWYSSDLWCGMLTIMCDLSAFISCSIFHRLRFLHPSSNRLLQRSTSLPTAAGACKSTSRCRESNVAKLT